MTLHEGKNDSWPKMIQNIPRIITNLSQYKALPVTHLYTKWTIRKASLYSVWLLWLLNVWFERHGQFCSHWFVLSVVSSVSVDTATYVYCCCLWLYPAVSLVVSYVSTMSINCISCVHHVHCICCFPCICCIPCVCCNACCLYYVYNWLKGHLGHS